MKAAVAWPAALTTALTIALTVVLCAALLAGCGAARVPSVAPAPAATPVAPEAGSGWRQGLQPLSAAAQVVASAHPLATRAGLAALRAGGSAADAALAAQMVLGLVEPQSSGLGGGGFIVHYRAAGERLQSWDGRETAPAAAQADDLRWIAADDHRAPLPDARASGRSIGVPGLLPALQALHGEHGRLPWAHGFDAAIALAERGFAIPQRLAEAIAAHRLQLLRDPDAAALFLHPDGSARAAGSLLRNPAYAATLRRLAAEGAQALYRGEIAADIVAEVARSSAGEPAQWPLTPGRMTAADLAGYRAVERAPVCGDFRRWLVCGMGPPSAGGIAVAQILGLLQQFPPRGWDALAVQRLVEAQRLAFADRNRHVADTDFVALPGRGVASLLDPAYLRARAALIDDWRSLGVAPAGRFDARPRSASADEGQGTTHVSIVDRWGNAVAMTSSVESSLGAWRVVRGFVLNNQLTDFSPVAAGAEGAVANRLQGGKRPRSSMAPTLVFERAEDGRRGALVAITGSPGGAAIIPFVSATLLGLLDAGLDAQAAAGLPHAAAFNTAATLVEADHPDRAATDALAQALQSRGQQVRRAPLTSGIATIVRTKQGWQAGVDPRREGAAAGD